MHARSIALSFLVAFALLGGCGGEPATPGVDAATPVDAGTQSDAGPMDAGPRPLAFTRGPAYPSPVAYAAAMILPVGSERYLYVMGGAVASRTGLNSILATCSRAQIRPNGSLGDWQDARDISTTAGSLPLVGHGAVRLNGEMGEVGVGLGGGGGPTGSLPFVYGGVVQADGTLGAWGRYDATLTEGQGFGSFVALAPHDLALVGGLGGAAGDVPLDRVVIAHVEDGAMSPMWRDGPTLPAPRFGQATIRRGDDIYLIGGENADGGLAPILQATRDGTGTVNGWARVGTLTATASFPAAAVHHDQAWVFGGLEGGRATGAASTRVSRTDIGSDGHLGSFARVPGGDLPLPLAASAYAYDDVTGHVYLVGGLTGEPLLATDAVVIGTLP